MSNTEANLSITLFVMGSLLAFTSICWLWTYIQREVAWREIGRLRALKMAELTAREDERHREAIENIDRQNAILAALVEAVAGERTEGRG